ncbi:hypothetical protein BKA58DRAFT_326410 [Alternaria rosae]|uniref:uncharacterized protein n=1 Tax=Alternaria rosae TaxID=1187941 RepID=UPI001E8DDA73|nr:uncharacterized protein BKA58DRAFT_326410 [Alternaria rosae]KAH6851523.1 hypothetical protein BKA58DRAFT_326410 [Alternaria rosae]
MYRYTSAHPSHYSQTYLHPPLYPHNLTSRSYDTTYMSRPYPYTEPRRYNSYYETTYARPSTSHRPNTSYRPSQTEYWRYVKPVQTVQPDRPPRKSSLKKTEGRHVHFDLPPVQGTSSRTVRIAEEERQRERERVRAREKDRERNRGRERERGRESRYIPSPARPPIRHYETERKMPKKQYATYSHSFEYDSQLHHRERYRSSTSPQRTSLPRSTSHYTHHQPSSLPYIHDPLPSIPTVYIITFAADLTPTESSRASLLSSQLPVRSPPIPHLYTIDARTVRPPSPSLCREYSGVSPRIQDIVMEDAEARYAARKAVERVVRFGESQRSKTRAREWGRGGTGGGGDGRGMEVSLSICCHSGTHRSVAIAERIAQCVKSEVGRRGCEQGVRVVCRHVHRVKGRRDPF